MGRLFLSFLIGFSLCAADMIFPGQPTLRYIQHGDLDIGGILSALSYSAESLCGDSEFMDASYHFAESVVRAIDLINQNKSILADVELGFVILDDCMKEMTAAVQAMAFLPRVSFAESSQKPFSNSSRSLQNQNDTNICIDTHPSKRDGMEDIKTTSGNVLEAYDVVGVICCLRSSNSMSAAQVLSAGQIPVMSFTSTSQKLSNKELYPYFFRIVPSDDFLVAAQVELIVQMKWTYVSVVFSEGDFGELAYQTFKKKLTQIPGFCIATSHRISQSDTYTDTLNIVKDLIKHRKARIVVAFTDPPPVPMLLKASAELGYSDWFIWLSNESWKIFFTTQAPEDLPLGIIAGFPAFPSPSYNEYAASMTPKQNSNPWFVRQWERLFNCSTIDPECSTNHDAFDIRGYNTYVYADGAYDAVLTFATAVEDLIAENCPGKTGRDVRNCFSGQELKEKIQQSSFYAPSGLVEFDQQGNRVSTLVFEQIIPSSENADFDLVKVALYDTRTSTITTLRNISFAHDTFHSVRADDIPESVCSYPCGRGQYRIQREPACCWDCRTCRSNEILINGYTGCQRCPPFTWPDAMTNYTDCSPIEPIYADSEDPLVVLILCLSAIGVFGVAMVTYAYIKHGDARVIKASSKELSYLQLVAILAGYLTPPVLSLKPDNTVCVIGFFMFCLSFSWLYSPLLVKAIRIHRIFQAGKSATMRLKFISPKSQIVFASFLILIQVVLCAVITFKFKPSAALTQTVLTEKFVELSCDWTLPGLISFLTYNLVLVSLCSVFAFKTRKLPDNFNESRFISLCVYTTLIIWVAFVPTYFTASTQYVRKSLLSLSLLVNHSVAIVFLYLPKIYAAIHLVSPANTVSQDHRSTELTTGNSRFLTRRTAPTSDTIVVPPTIPEVQGHTLQGQDSGQQCEGSKNSDGSSEAQTAQTAGVSCATEA